LSELIAVPRPRRALLVEEDRELAATLIASLERGGFTISWKRSADEALGAIDDEEWTVVIAGVALAGIGGAALCRRMVANRPDVPVILVTARGTMEMAIAAIRAGAYDFLARPFDVELLGMAFARAAEHAALRAEVKRLRDEVGPGAGDESRGMIGASPAMREVHELIAQVSGTDASVLVTGASGTGKELVARALHAAGRRRSGPFVAVNCAAIPETLLESELFGHARGAFTEAKSARRGLFLKAHGGTLFLDEVADLPLATQPKLLRALQERTVRPVGADREESFDVRLITATNRDLELEVAERRFREDLFYRLNVVRIDVPPLAARGNDILLLAQYFVRRAAAHIHKRVTGLSGAAAKRLLSYRWPGNVRELENNMERAVALARSEEITVDDLPEKIRNHAPRDAPGLDADPAELLAMDEVERRHILRVLRAVGGSKSHAAGVLGLDRSTLYRKLEQYSRDGRS
jgi:DNA-binding NtrC family response regulator